MIRASALVLLVAAPVVAQEPGGWTLRVGHAYSSARALRQPATAAAVREAGGPWVTALDAGVLASRLWGGVTVDLGARIAGGTARARSERVHGMMVRGYALVPAGLVLALGGEIEADGGFDAVQGTLGLEATPFGSGPLAIGIWSDREGRRGLRWRPWLGAGFGNVFEVGTAASAVADDVFWRAHLRIEAAWRDGPIAVEAEGTAMLLDGEARGANFGKAAASVPLGRGFAFTVTAERGRRPPRFQRSSLVTIGIGYRAGPE